jgi:hypothetical protein
VLKVFNDAEVRCVCLLGICSALNLPVQFRPGPASSRMSDSSVSRPESGPEEIHPQQTSEQLLLHLSERPHASDGEAPWNDRHGRRADELPTCLSCRLPPTAVIGAGGDTRVRHLIASVGVSRSLSDGGNQKPLSRSSEDRRAGSPARRRAAGVSGQSGWGHDTEVRFTHARRERNKVDWASSRPPIKLSGFSTITGPRAASRNPLINSGILLTCVKRTSVS